MTHTASSTPRLVPFAYGFRPFFLAAIAYGCIALIAWMFIRANGIAPLGTMPPQLWHGHEMLFGFVVAAIAGFLLTAVPSWTGTRGFGGWPLILLSALWLTGRLAFAFANHLSSFTLAVLELAFLPALAIAVAVPLIRSLNRNTPLLLVLGVLWFADAAFLCAITIGDVVLASKTLVFAVDVILLLITVIGGRIVPAFTANALRRRGNENVVHDYRYAGYIAIVAMIAVAVIDAYAPTHPAALYAAAVAAIAHAVRLAGWGGARSWREPIVWVLHLAYLWLPVGLGLKALYLAFGVGWASGWLHALTIGAAATMIVAVITRASLGHTGRPLKVSRPIAFAYFVLVLAAIARTLAAASPSFNEWSVRLAALLWTIAFATVLVVYSPILLRPRADGRSG